MDNVDIPEYFICPISLQIMKDPVTAVTGITYDRGSIERWLLKGHNTICPVTKQPLPKDSELTPNNTLRRLIRAWCTANCTNDMDQVPSTPKPPLSKFYFENLIRGLWLPNSQLQALRNLEAVAKENNESNRKQMVEAGIAKGLISFVVACHRKEEKTGLAEALNILYLIRSSLSQTRLLLIKHDEIVEALMWVLNCDLNDDSLTIRTHAVYALKIVLAQKANSGTMERLKPELFHRIICYIRENSYSLEGTNAALQVMLDSSPCARNRMMMVEAGAVFDLIELEFKSTEKKTTELIFGIMFHLCSCADGRAQFLSHAAGLAVVTKRILKVSPAADDRAMLILSLISKFSGTVGVLQEMLRVGAVAKLCMVLQSNCASYLKDKAREILRTHSNAWKDSPCIDIPSLTSDKVCQLTL